MSFDFLSGFGALGGISLATVLGFLFVLTVVVFFHELGHFLIARWSGVKVLVFSIGFGPELVGFNDRFGTRWKVSAVPLGGYVKFAGDENAASVPDEAALARMSAEERRHSFFSQPLAKRAAIVVAGPLANFLLAIMILASLFMIFGKQVTSPRIDSVRPGSSAAAAGFQKGDMIVAIDGRNIQSYSDVERIIATHPGQPLDFTIERGQQRVSVTATPELRAQRDPFGNDQRVGQLDIGGPAIRARVASVTAGSAAAAAGFEVGDLIVSINDKPVETFNEIRDIVAANPDKPLSFVVRRAGRTIPLTATPKAQSTKDGTRRVGVLGISGDHDPEEVKLVRYGPLSALALGVEETWFVVERTLAYLRDLFVGKASPDQLGGPIRIAQMSGQVASLGIVPLLNFTAIMSISIGLLNLFPIPLLDGGHLLFYGIEALRGRPLSMRAQEMGFRVGLAIVLMLMIFTTYNDISQISWIKAWWSTS
jgi:regulator of sigma E protease